MKGLGHTAGPVHTVDPGMCFSIRMQGGFKNLCSHQPSPYIQEKELMEYVHGSLPSTTPIQGLPLISLLFFPYSQENRDVRFPKEAGSAWREAWCLHRNGLGLLTQGQPRDVRWQLLPKATPEPFLLLTGDGFMALEPVAATAFSRDAGDTNLPSSACGPAACRAQGLCTTAAQIHLNHHNQIIYSFSEGF